MNCNKLNKTILCFCLEHHCGGQIDQGSSPNSRTDYTTHITLGKLLSSLGLVPVFSVGTAELATNSCRESQTLGIMTMTVSVGFCQTPAT